MTITLEISEDQKQALKEWAEDVRREAAAFEVPISCEDLPVLALIDQIVAT